MFMLIVGFYVVFVSDFRSVFSRLLLLLLPEHRLPCNFFFILFCLALLPCFSYSSFTYVWSCTHRLTYTRSQCVYLATTLIRTKKIFTSFNFIFHKRFYQVFAASSSFSSLLSFFACCRRFLLFLHIFPYIFSVFHAQHKHALGARAYGPI